MSIQSEVPYLPNNPQLEVVAWEYHPVLPNYCADPSYSYVKLSSFVRARLFAAQAVNLFTGRQLARRIGGLVSAEKRGVFGNSAWGHRCNQAKQQKARRLSLKALMQPRDKQGKYVKTSDKSHYVKSSSIQQQHGNEINELDDE